MTEDSKQAAPPSTITTPKVEDSVFIATSKVEDSVSVAASKIEDSVSIAAPSATAKVEESVPIAAPKIEGTTDKTLAGDEGREKLSMIEKTAEMSTAGIARHVSFGGVQQLGQQQQQQQLSQSIKSGTGNQGLSLGPEDLDNEADMEGVGDMEGRLMKTF